MFEGALSGYKILDVTHYMAGPYCTKLLAMYGAEVIKVEKPETGDAVRRLGPFVGDDPHIEKSVHHLFLNAGKKSISLNLKAPTGVEIFKRLVKEADILVENFEPRVMPSLGLAYEDLVEIRPDLVMVSISNFGQTGPYRDYRAAEIVEYALSGLMKLTGAPDREPLKLGLDVAQYTAGQSAVPPMLAALYSARSTNEGQHVDISIMDYCAGLAEVQAGLYDCKGQITERIGNYNDKGHPWGNFPCRDGWVTIAIHGTRMSYLADMMGIPELKDARFANPTSRLKHREEIDSFMLPWLSEHSRNEPFEYLNTKPECGAGWVRNAQDLLECPQLASQGFYGAIEHPLLGKVRFPGPPCKLSKTPMQVERAPLLGEHNEKIYCAGLGYTKSELVKLRQAGVI